MGMYANSVKVTSILKSKPMHMVTINNTTMCDTGPLQVSSLACDEYRHHQGYKINFRSSPVESNAIIVYQTKIEF